MVGHGRQHLRVGACLSLSGRYARFGVQVAHALEAWRSLDGAADLVVEDDQSDPRRLEAAIRQVASRCDLLLGPYSTQLMRIAGRVAVEEGWLVWNHGGSGDDVETGYPGHVVSVLTPTSRYSEPFIRLLVRCGCTKLWIVQGKGSFGRQVATGAELTARRFGIDATCASREDDIPSSDLPSTWALLTAGTFEDDVETVKRVQGLRRRPQMLCSVAAGVHEFADAVGDAEGIFGVGQWFPGHERSPDVGPSEEAFLAAYSSVTSVTPDYPAVQAAAGAVLAAHCARQADGLTRDLWPVAVGLETRTLFGGFKIDPASGAQTKHETQLMRWTAEGLTAV